MRPLLHPSAKEITVEGVLHALSDTVRAAIFARIADSPERPICADFLRVRGKTLPRSTLSQHFKTLREAGLIRCERSGVELRSFSRGPDIERRFPGLITVILTAHEAQRTSNEHLILKADCRERGQKLSIDRNPAEC